MKHLKSSLGDLRRLFERTITIRDIAEPLVSFDSGHSIVKKIMKPNLEDSIQLAMNAHRGQKDRYGEPFILHPLRVMFRFQSELDRMVGILHDVVEDTDYTAEDLRKLGYSGKFLRALDGVTRRDGESYEKFVLRSKANPISRRVKIADLEDNMDIRRMKKVTSEDRERLARYRKAWGELQIKSRD